MRNIAVAKLIRYGNSSSDPTIIRYRSIADFLERNPRCCVISKVRNPEPLTWDVELEILYRKHTEGAEPYEGQTVQFGPRLENMEESASPLTPELYQLYLRHPGGPVVS